MAVLLIRYAEHFSNGNLPKENWAYIASVLMYPFHKKLPEGRTSIIAPTVPLVTVGSVLTRFGCRVFS
jgi:hypothetical protein